jgi:hypothetical protein
VNAAKQATRNLSVQDRVGLLGDVISGSYDFPTSSSVYGRFNYSVNPFVVNGTVETTLTVDGNMTTDVNFNASSLVLTFSCSVVGITGTRSMDQSLRSFLLSRSRRSSVFSHLIQSPMRAT